MICNFAAAVVLIIFNEAYSHFSHNVASVYMTWAFSYPSLAGIFYLILYQLRNKLNTLVTLDFYRLAYNLFFSGIASLALVSVLVGVFEIAGTASAYTQYLWYLGCGLTSLGLLGILLMLVKAIEVGQEIPN